MRLMSRPFFCLLPLVAAGALMAQENAPRPRLAFNTPAPEIVASTLDGKGTSLAALRNANTGKVLVLQFAGLTDPIFRNHATTVDRLAARDVDKAVFVILYQKEFHAADSDDPLDLNVKEGFNIPAPASYAERLALAATIPQRLSIQNQTILVDAWNNTSSLRYGSYANMTFIIDAKGILAAGYPFMDPTKVQVAIDTLAAGKPLPDELRGLLRTSGPAPFDAAVAAMDMTGGRGPASIAAVLDRATIPDDKRAALLTAVAGHLAQVQSFRQARPAPPNAPARAGAATRAGTAAATKSASPLDLQQAQTDLRASAEKLKPIIKQTLNAKDAALLFAALDNLTPAQRLFAQ